MGYVHISYGGSEYFILAGGRSWRFEDHPYCGPIVLGKKGAPLECQPPDSSPFWKAASSWYKLGKRVHEVGGKKWAVISG